MRILSLDVGEKKIGIAISDALGITAQPLQTIRRDGQNSYLRLLQAVIAEKNVTKVIVGLPLNMNGTEGRVARGIYEFVDRLRENVSVPVQLWDERLTTMEAERILLQADVSRKRRKKADDAIAAQLILQSYLNSHRSDEGR